MKSFTIIAISYRGSSTKFNKLLKLQEWFQPSGLPINASDVLVQIGPTFSTVLMWCSPACYSLEADKKWCLYVSLGCDCEVNSSGPSAPPDTSKPKSLSSHKEINRVNDFLNVFMLSWGFRWLCACTKWEWKMIWWEHVYTQLQEHVPPVHYWPAAEASHFPVFIKTWPIKFYLQSIIRTLQINQGQLNQCFPEPVPGPHGPHGHSIFSAGLIHGGLQWSHTAHPLACSWLLDSIVPRCPLWSAVYSGSLLRGIEFDFINSPVELKDKQVNSMFHLVLRGHAGEQ